VHSSSSAPCPLCLCGSFSLFGSSLPRQASILSIGPPMSTVFADFADFAEVFYKRILFKRIHCTRIVQLCAWPTQNTSCRSAAETPSPVEGSGVEGRNLVGSPYDVNKLHCCKMVHFSAANAAARARAGERAALFGSQSFGTPREHSDRIMRSVPRRLQRKDCKSSADSSTSRRIADSNPGPIVSPACTGTTVARPSG